jgi:hypothetical protein
VRVPSLIPTLSYPAATTAGAAAAAAAAAAASTSILPLLCLSAVAYDVSVVGGREYSGRYTETV